MQPKRAFLIYGAFFIVVVGMTACGDDGAIPTGEAAAGLSVTGPIRNQRTVFSDGLHNENTEMLRLADGSLLLAFRGGSVAQTGLGSIIIFRSTDDLATPCPGPFCVKTATVSVLDRDIRDPKLVEFDGRLFLYAISRVDGLGVRDLFSQSWTVRSESTDGGATWTAPVKTLEERFLGFEQFWGGWRFVKRSYKQGRHRKERLYMTAYNDLNSAVALFSSDDGRSWHKRGEIIRNVQKVPSETEFVFFGNNNRRGVALIRQDDEGFLTDGHTEICYGTAPVRDTPALPWTWDCRYRLDARLDGPGTLVTRRGRHRRVFVAAREHQACTKKRTALYELRDLFDPDTRPAICKIAEVDGVGDTAYTAWAPVLNGGDEEYLLSWYSSPIDLPWLEGQFAPSDILVANVDLSRTFEFCVPPVSDTGCQQPVLPPSQPADLTGIYLLTVQTVHWSGESGVPNFVFFVATVADDPLTVSLQPIDQLEFLVWSRITPVGPPLSPVSIQRDPDGRFVADFGDIQLPAAAFPLLDETLPLNLKRFVIEAVATGPQQWCGGLDAVVQVLPGPSNVLLLEGSQFGTVPFGPAGPTGISTGCVE